MTGIRHGRADLSAGLGDEGVHDAVAGNALDQDTPDRVAAMPNCTRALRPGGRPSFPLGPPLHRGVRGGLGAKAHVTVSEYLRESSGRTSRADRPCFPPSAHLNLAIDAGCTLRRVREPTLLDPADRTAHVPQFIVVLAVRG